MTWRESLKHPDKPGAGSEKRKSLSSDDKIKAVMHEFEQGTLRDSNGKHVTDKDQALAIAYSEAGVSKNEKMEDVQKLL